MLPWRGARTGVATLNQHIATTRSFRVGVTAGPRKRHNRVNWHF